MKGRKKRHRERDFAIPSGMRVGFLIAQSRGTEISALFLQISHILKPSPPDKGAWLFPISIFRGRKDDPFPSRLTDIMLKKKTNKYFPTLFLFLKAETDNAYEQQVPQSQH